MRLKAYVNTAGVLLVATALAGCGSLHRDPIQVGSVPEDYRTTHPIVLAELERTLDVPVASGARELNIAVRSNIRAFAVNFAEAGTGSLFVMMPAGSPNEAAARKVQNEVVQALVDGGAVRNRIIVQHYDAGQYGSSAAIHLSYNGVAAATNTCGKWPEDLGDTVENKNYYNYGCATQANLAAILANPLDLLGPRQMSQIDATERAAVIEGYQKGPNGAASEVSY